MAMNGNLDPTSPNGVATANFTLARRGYEPDEVRAFLRQAADELARVHSVNAHLEQRVTELNERAPERKELDEATVISMLGEDTARVLSTAREAAAQMRNRAEENVARMLREAQDTSARIRQEADLDAAKRREDATAVAQSEMDHAKQEGRRMVGEARAVRERILGDLVRRRDAGRLQIEQLHAQKQKMLNTFSTTRAQLLDAINGLGPNEPEQEVVPTALDEEMTLAGKAFTLDHENETPEVPVAQSVFTRPAPATPTAPAAPTQPETSRFPLAPAGHGDSTPVAHEVTSSVAVVLTEEQAETMTVMTLPPPAPPAEVDTMVWLRSLGDVAPAPVAEAVAAEPEVESVVELAPVEEPAEEPAEEIVEAFRLGPPPVDMLRAEVLSWQAPQDASSLADAPSAVAQPAPVAAPAAAPAPAVPSAPVADSRPSADDLFARIRSARADVVTGPSELVAADDAQVSAAEPAPVLSVIAQRNEVVGPIEQSIARRLKRTLADEQNEVFDRLRRQADLPTAESLVGTLDQYAVSYRDAVEEDLRTAVVQGALSIGGMSDAALQAAIERNKVVEDTLEELAGEIAAPLHARLVRGIEQAAGDAAEASEILRAIYREWKTQRIDDAAAHLALTAYGRGAYAAVVPGTPICWVVDPDRTPCSDADDNVLGGTVCAGEPFPTGHLRAPAYPGCRCAIAPTQG